MMNIKEELKNFEAHCLQSGQLQVAELQRNSINKINELEAIIRGRDELINNAVSSRIAELEKERNELKVKNATLDDQLHEFYRAMELISKIATVVPRDTAILEVINCYRTGELLEAHNLEQQVKGVSGAIETCKKHDADNLGEEVITVIDLGGYRLGLEYKAKALKEQVK